MQNVEKSKNANFFFRSLLASMKIRHSASCPCDINNYSSSLLVKVKGDRFSIDNNITERNVREHGEGGLENLKKWIQYAVQQEYLSIKTKRFCIKKCHTFFTLFIVKTFYFPATGHHFSSMTTLSQIKLESIQLQTMFNTENERSNSLFSIN